MRLKLMLSVTASLVILLTSCSKEEKNSTSAKVIPVKVMSISISNTGNDRNYVGTIKESFAVSLSFLTIGTVEQVFVSEGQKVQKGQLLATLNKGSMQNAYNISLSTLNKAQDAYNRLSKLHEKGSISDIKFVEVETGLQQAIAMESIAKKNLQDCKLFAPFSGVIAQRAIEPGANIMPSVEAFKLVKIDNVDVKISVSENEIGTTLVGQKAIVNVPALGNKTFYGSIKNKGIAANSLSHTYEVQIGLNNPKHELMPGMVCKVFIHQKSISNNIVIPNRAVQILHDGRHFVWLANKNIAKRKFITIGSLTDYGVSVESGLSEGDKIIVEDYQKVSEGMPISIND